MCTVRGIRKHPSVCLAGKQAHERLKEAVKKLQNHKEILKAEYKKEKKQRKQFEVQLRQSAMKSSNLPSNKTTAAWQAGREVPHFTQKAT